MAEIKPKQGGTDVYSLKLFVRFGPGSWWDGTYSESGDHVLKAFCPVLTNISAQPYEEYKKFAIMTYNLIFTQLD